MTLALYTSDTLVPYEVISLRSGPLVQNYVLGHLTASDIFETSLVTAAGILHADELQRRTSLQVLLCMADLPDAPLKLDKERDALQAVLTDPHFAVTELFGNEADKWKTLRLLADDIHLFHFSGHGIERMKQPQRSGLMFWDAELRTEVPLNALEVKYRVKLGSHPIVFLNGCFGGSKARIPLGAPDELPPDAGQSSETGDKPRQSSNTADNTRQVMSLSSSFIHVGAIAVMAPRWAIYDETATRYAEYWYRYLAMGCSVGEAALLAKIQCAREMTKADRQLRPDYNVFSYVIWGDPTLRLYPLEHLLRHREVVAELLQLKQTLHQARHP